ncbi:MAG: hypothetical protein NZ534_09035, partial [Bacteroidia bacterium]|nr:hypothetical protein [Bacteroidia bacterium]
MIARAALWAAAIASAALRATAQPLRPAARDMEVAENLAGVWTTPEGRMRAVPSFPEGESPLVLTRRVWWSSLPEDTLYLYREGAGWRCETYVNGRLISVVERPFGETLDVLPPSFWRVGENEIRLRLTAGDKLSTEGRERYPPPFAGVHAPVYLLRKSASGASRFVHPRLCDCDTTIWYMPFASAAEAALAPLNFEDDLR